MSSDKSVAPDLTTNDASKRTGPSIANLIIDSSCIEVTAANCEVYRFCPYLTAIRPFPSP
uniref:Uncharacterized protein n=1 Tax=uncultured marine virus TaxID=186617 RepID=A0A0F7L508_9VIRU|nr:hypothetical protein [uncultured marine virus]